MSFEQKLFFEAGAGHSTFERFRGVEGQKVIEVLLFRRKIAFRRVMRTYQTKSENKIVTKLLRMSRS